MKKYIAIAAIIIAGLFSNQAKAQSTNVLGGPAWDAIRFLGTGSNWMAAGYGIISADGKKYGGGVAAGYKVSDFVVPVLRLDYYDGRVWMPSGSLQLQAPLQILGKFTLIPFAFTGIATAIGGAGSDNGTPVGIFGAGAAVRLWGHFDLIGDFEYWRGANFADEKPQIRLGGLWKF